MSQNYKVSVDITATDKTGRALNSARKGFKEAFGEVATGAMRRAGESATDLIAQLPAMTVELANLGVQAKSATLRFERFAGGADEATMFLASFNEGTLGTVDRMEAMSSAGRLLQMGLVDTGEEMSSIAAMATRLGDQTMGAGDRIADFSAMLANQSVPRLDNFGISSGRVRKRIDELLQSGQALDREQAFKMAVMEEGTKALDRLGDTTGTAAHKMDVLKAAAQDAKIGLGEMLVEMVEGTGSVDDFAGRIRALPDTLRQVGAMGKAVYLTLEDINRNGFNATPAETFTNSLKRSAAEMAGLTSASEELRYAHIQGIPPVERQREAMSELSYVSEDVKQKLQSQVQSQGMLEHTILAASAAMDQGKIATESYAAATEASALAQAALVQGLKDATDAQIAQAAISELGQALEEGKITAETYATAVQETQLKFGLADEKSIFLAESLGTLTDSLSSGAVSAENYDEALADMIMQSNAAGVEVETFANALDGLPDKKIVTLEFNMTTTGTPPNVEGGDMGAQGSGRGGVPQFQHGGQFIVGDRGAEVVTVQPLGGPTYNDTFNITDGRAMGAINENRRRQRRQELARMM